MVAVLESVWLTGVESVQLLLRDGGDYLRPHKVYSYQHNCVEWMITKIRENILGVTSAFTLYCNITASSYFSKFPSYQCKVSL